MRAVSPFLVANHGAKLHRPYIKILVLFGLCLYFVQGDTL